MQSRERSLLSDSGKWNGSRLKRSIALAVILVFGLTLFSYPSQQVSPVAAQSNSLVSLIKDLNQEPVGELDNLPTVLGNTAFFIHTNQLGAELWKSDGTQAGTRLVKDIAYGPASSTPKYSTSSLTVFQNRLFFIANDHIHGEELWTSDGSENGTYMVQDLNLGGTDSVVKILGTTQNALFFQASILTNGKSIPTLFTYNSGTVTSLVSNLDLSSIVRSRSTQDLLFSVQVSPDSNQKFQVWRSDGTKTGTFVIAETSRPAVFDIIQNKLVFIAQVADFSEPAQLWVSDGTVGGTHNNLLPNGQVGDLSPSTQSLSTRLYFRIGNALWSSDGSQSGTQVVLESAGLSQIKAITVGDVTYIAGRNAEKNTWELWRKDASSNPPTLLIAKVVAAPQNSEIGNLIIQNGRLYFLAGSYPALDLWTSDGTQAGTVLVEEGPFIQDVLAFKNGWLVATATGLRFGTGPTASNQSVTLDNGGRNGSAISYNDLSNANHISSDGNQVYVVTPTQTGKQALWRSNGTAEGTVPLKEFETSDNIYFLQALNNRFLFSVNDKLFQTNGTPAGTSELAPLPGVTTGVINNQLIGMSGGLGLWTSDGTSAGTNDLGAIPGSDKKLIKGLFSETSLNDKLYFFAQEPTNFPFLTHNSPAQQPEAKPVELWQTDGTVAGTKVVTTLSNQIQYVSNLVVLGNKVYFALKLLNGYELWASDGTAAGTQRVSASPTFTGSGVPTISVLNGKLYFPNWDAAHGTELWISDGTSAGTRLLKDINPGPGNGLARIQRVHDTLFLTASDGVSGFELWASDGTAEGIHQVADIAPGPYSSTPVSFAAGSDFIAFSADDGVIGRELYKIAAPTAVTLQGSAVTSAGAGPQSQVAIPLSYGNNGVTKAVSVTLSLELPNGLSYVSDTFGISPTITGNLVEWKLPDAGYLSKRSASVVLSTPDKPYGTRIPLNFSLKANGATPLTIKSEVLIAHQAYLPIVRR